MTLRAVKGMNDILPDQIGRWHRLETTFRQLAELYGYREVRTPVVEPTALFVRAVGEATDVVEKEMYSFHRHSDDLTLRPEGTAGAARAYIEHNLHAREKVTRWYYLGPMFRGERPARGRYRQFYQAGAEIYGDPGPLCDAEMIDMVSIFLQKLGVQNVEVLVNSLGSMGSRQRYRQALLDYFTPQADKLSEDSRRRLQKNPLRILDSKAPEDQALCAGAPAVLDVLDDDDRMHFEKLKEHLDVLGTPYKVDPRLVRGLDYYTRTLFEVRGSGGELGAQNALGGGGRYDAMLGELGCPEEKPCIGFAMGLERILLAMGESKVEAPGWVYLAPMNEAGQRAAVRLGRELREAGIEARVDGLGQKLKTMMKRAGEEGSGARVALIVGESEIERGVVGVKNLVTQKQVDVPVGEVVQRVRELLAAGAGTPPAGSQGER